MTGAPSLTGRRALVTGANRGIGTELVRQLRDRGMHVFLGSRDVGAGERTAAAIGGTGVTVIAIDVADAASVEAAHDAVGPEGIDVLINNAALNPRGDVSAELAEETWQVNLLGPARVARAFVRTMRDRGWGRVVNVSTELATRSHAQRGLGIYALTKVAMNAMTRVLAEEVTESGVLVNAISPGWCRTDMGGSGASRSAADGAASIVGA